MNKSSYLFLNNYNKYLYLCPVSYESDKQKHLNSHKAKSQGVCHSCIYARMRDIDWAELQRRIQAMEMRCYRKILHISYTDHVTKVEVRNRIQHAIGRHEHLTTVQRRKLKWYRYTSRSYGLAKTISCKALWGDQEEEEDKGNDGKTTSESGQDWTFQSHKGLLKIEKEAAGCRIIGGASMTLQVKGQLLKFLLHHVFFHV